MKSAISPDIWETKRMLITKLYKDEEWPLKQVIKLVQTRDFHPSESQLRSRLKKWHITKPSRKKYDGSRRLSGAKKNANAQSTLPSSSTYHTLHSQKKTDESDSLSEGSRPSVSVPEMSISPSNRYILPSSPHEDQISNVYASQTTQGQITMAPSTPMTPAVYSVDEQKRPGETIYFYPQEHSPATTFAPHMPVSYAHFPFDPSLALGQEYMGYNGVHYLPSQSQHYKDAYPLPELPPPLIEGPGSSSGSSQSWSYGQPPSPSGVYTRQPSASHGHNYFAEDGLHALAPPIYQM
ncbi:hypothetical protein BDV18DRAFT_162945 [Aspergillus unguis]